MLNLFGAKKTSPHIHRYTIFVGGAKFESWLSWSFRNNTHLPLQAMEDISSIKKYAGTISPTKSSTSLHVALNCFFFKHHLTRQDPIPFSGLSGSSFLKRSPTVLSQLSSFLEGQSYWGIKLSKVPYLTPKPSMYAMFRYLHGWFIFMVNVGEYTWHGLSFGMCIMSSYFTQQLII